MIWWLLTGCGITVDVCPTDGLLHLDRTPRVVSVAICDGDWCEPTDAWYVDASGLTVACPAGAEVVVEW